jgi:methionyl-tRNA formyltransferase
MRFAITAVDRCLPIFDALLAAGWEPVKLFTVPPSPVTNLNQAVIARAVERKIPVQVTRMTKRDLADLGQRGCEVMVCASYDWRIGDWRIFMPYGVNFHPSPLPEARGPYPAFQAVLEGRRRWGVTCHKLDQAFDTGAILADEPFDLDERDCHESLGLKTQMAFARLARRVADDFPRLWTEARPQEGGSYWPRLGDADRELDFTQPVEAILRKVRAFGLTETVVKLNGAVLYVRRAVGWTEAHGHAPGAVAHQTNRQWVIAAADGYIGLVEWSPISLGAAQLIGRSFPPQL